MVYGRRNTTKRRPFNKRGAKGSGKGRKPFFRQAKPYGIKAEPFPMRLHTRAVYTDTQYVSTTYISGSVSDQEVYNLNAIYRPNQSGAGTSVKGWSAFNTLYEKYIVKGAKVEVSFDDPTADGGVCWVSLAQRTGMSGLTYKQIAECPTTYTGGLNNSGSQRKKFELYVTPWSLIGVSKLEYLTNSDRYASAMASEPAVLAILRCGIVGNNSGLTNDVVMTMSIKITYYLMLYQRNGLNTT